MTKLLAAIAFFILAFLIFTSCATPTMVRKAVLDESGKLKPVGPWQPFIKGSGDTIIQISKLKR